MKHLIKKLSAFLVMLMCVSATAQAQVRLTKASPEGTVGMLNGREAIVVDLGGSIGKVAIATLNVGATNTNDFSGTTSSDYNGNRQSFSTASTGLTNGWYVPSVEEMTALAARLTWNTAKPGPWSAGTKPGAEINFGSTSLFIPATGYWENGSWKNNTGTGSDRKCVYWTSTAAEEPSKAHAFEMSKDVFSFEPKATTIQTHIRPFCALPVVITATSASSTGFDTEKYTNIFDGITTNKWCDNFNTNSPVSVEFETSQPIYLNSYYLYTGCDVTNGGKNRNPNAWKLYAKVNKSDSWTLISSVTDANLPYECSAKSQDYAVTDVYQKTMYQYFKFEITGVKNATVFEVGEIGLNYNTFDVNLLTVQDEEYISSKKYGKRNGRVSNVPTVTINGCTYALYKDYYYIPYESSAAQTNLKHGVSGLCCVLTQSTAEGALSIPSFVDFTLNGTKFSAPVVAIGEEALGYDSNKVTALTIPASVVVVEKYAIEDRKSDDAVTVSKLKSITLEDGDNTIFMNRGSRSYGALSKAAALQNIYIGRNIDYNPFYDGVLQGVLAKDLTVTYGAGVTTIPANMFRGAQGLKSITLPEAISAIPGYMCDGCTSLTSIKIPTSVRNIAENAFNGCTNIEYYTFSNTTPCTVGENALSGISKFKIFVPENSVEAYCEAWPQYESHIISIPLNEEIDYMTLAITKTDGTTNRFMASKVAKIDFVTAGDHNTPTNLPDITHDSPVGTIGMLDGLEAMVVDLGGEFGKVCIATRNPGESDSNPYGNLYTRDEAFSASNSKNWGKGWYLPSRFELKALADFGGSWDDYEQAWEFTINNSTLRFPAAYPVTGSLTGRYWSRTANYRSGDGMSPDDFYFLSFNKESVKANVEPILFSSYRYSARPFHKMPSTEPEPEELSYSSPVGAIGMLDGREAMVLDLKGIGKIAIATQNVGATEDNPYGSYEDFDKGGVEYGIGWYMPTETLFKALFETYAAEWDASKNATRFTVVNGSAYLYLPAAGYQYFSQIKEKDETGYYWLIFDNIAFTGAPYYKFSRSGSLREAKFTESLNSHDRMPVRPFHNLR